MVVQYEVAAQEPTVALLRRVRGGDARAREILFRRYLPLLRRWAHGRLPATARGPVDTDDLVQVTLVRALHHLEDFESAGSGSFLAYLRQILLNQVRDEIRRQQRRPPAEPLDIELIDADAPTLVEQMVGQERLAAYEWALANLPKRQQELIVMRLEFGLSYPEIAAETGGTVDAVRMMISRALVQLAEQLSNHRET
ncbi:sigma-70 family RNA polymerase sigma factor [Dokdonella soli]